MIKYYFVINPKKAVYSILFSCFASLLFCNFAYSQSTNCAGAPALAINDSCISTSYNVENAFGNSGVADPTCLTTTSYRDGWYTITTSSITTQIEIECIGNRRLGVALYSGTCGTLSQVRCDIDANFTNGNVTLADIPVTPNTTYYIRLMRINNAFNNDMVGDICVTDTTGNDECAGATTLMINNSCTTTTYNLESTFGNSGVADPSCVNTTSYRDGWFNVTTSPTTTQIDIECVGIRRLGVAIYSGTCGALTEVDCDIDDNFTDGNVTLTGVSVLPNTTYFIRLMRTNNAFNNDMTGDICVVDTTPIANDDCSGAITVPVNIGLNNCSTTTNGTTVGATQSIPANNCNGFVGSADDDVWYSFVALNSTQVITVTPGTLDDLVLELFASCGGASLQCADNTITTAETITANSLVIGDTYYFRVYSYGGNGDQGTFDVCVSGNLPITNDNCSGAIAVPVNTGLNNCSTTTNGTTVGATQSIPATNCNGFVGSADDDVWYSFIATNSTQVIEVTPGTLDDLVLELFSSCSGTSLECADNTIATAETITANGLVIGNTYYLRVYSYGGNGDQGTFDVCVSGEPLSNCAASPENLTAIATSTVTGTLSWDAPTPPPGLGYEYIISTDNTTTTPGDDIAGTTTATSLNLTGLSADTTYYVFVRGICNATENSLWISTLFSTGCADIVTTPSACPLIAGEQGTNPFIADPFDPDPSFLLDCAAPSVTLEAHSNLKETTSYVVEKIEYNPPVAFTSFTASSANLTADDVWASSRTAIGFDFCFYDNSYSELLIGANAMVTFNSAIDPGDASGYAFNSNLPSTNGALFEQTIYGGYHDIDPAASIFDEVSTRIVDPLNIGCRKFVISWHDVPMYSDNSILYTGMIVLHETTNIIEVFMEEKRIDNNNISPWNGGNAIVGIQGEYFGPASNPANEYAVAPCRNGLDDNWETTNEAWRFVPDGNDILPSLVNWYVGSVDPSNLVGTGTTLPVNTPNTYIAEATYPSCGGPVTLTDAVIVTGANVWTSAAGTSDWNTAANWSNNTVPTDSEIVIIPDMTTTSGRFPIIIGGAPIPPAVSKAGCLTIENNGYLEVLNGGRLLVTGSITVEKSLILNDGNFLVRSGGNLVQISEGALNTNNNTGSIKMQRSLTGVASDSYVYWSSPVEDFDVQSVSPGTNGYIFEWTPTTANIYGNWINPTNPIMGQGKGYIIRDILGTTPEAGTITPPATTAEFIGTPRNGVLTTQITRGNHLPVDGNYPGPGDTDATPLDDNWNLIGNPYPSSISADAFIIENAAVITNDTNPSISGTIWLWRHENTTSVIGDPFYGDYLYNYDANQYASYNLSGANPSGFNGNIASGQSFFVLMEDIPGPTLSADITFRNTMRYFSISGDNDAYDNTNFLRTVNDQSTTTNIIERHRIWLDLIKTNDTATSILVGYIENATNDIDRLYDGFDLNTGDDTRLYSILDDKELSIQGKALPFNQEDRVPLGVVIGDNGIHQIAINAVDGLFENESQNIYLEDTYTNTIHNLRNSTYNFTSEIGTFNDRFILRYTDETLGVNSAQIHSGITIMAPKSEYVKITSSIGTINSINIYDVLGRAIFLAEDVNNQEFIIKDINLANGAYIVKVKLMNGKQKIQKVVLRP